MLEKKRLQVAVVGPGRLGQACALALLDDAEFSLAGLVRRPEATGSLPGRLGDVPLVTHFRDLPVVDLALVCVPPQQVAEVAHDLMQARVPIVECARLEGGARRAHYETLDGCARRYRVSAVVGAGWDPGLLPLLSQAFHTLIPHGQTVQHQHPGLATHHSAAVEALPGVRQALECELRAQGGALQRYVYVELQPEADFDAVRTRIAADPLFAGEATQVFQMDSLAALEAPEGEGLVLERHARGSAGPHASLVLEARYDVTGFAARVMLKAARRLPSLSHQAHLFSLEPGDD